MKVRRWLLVVGTATGLVVGAAAAGLTLFGLPPLQVAAWAGERSPMSVLRYVEQRLKGHPRLETLIAPLASRLRAQLEPEPPVVLADLGKGQQALGMPRVRYDERGRPQPVEAAKPSNPAHAASIIVPSVDTLRLALAQARPGSVIEILPGEYSLNSSLGTPTAGTPLLPIVVRARVPGSVAFVSRTVQAVVVSQPYWVFENLNWRGACSQDTDCEHAFHVVGRARGTVIVNNRITDFNAQIKINGEAGHWPDEGLVQFNSLENTRRRNTDNPVTPVDLVAASGWQLLDNRVANFAKSASQQPSYGLFMKGGGSGGRIERNLVICTPHNISQPGLRVGVSLGSGGTDRAVCRDSACSAEHRGGVVANNVVAHCNDAGIDISKATSSLVAHNTLVNTQGVLVRNPPSDAEVRYNALEGAIRSRAGTHATAEGNIEGAALSKLMSDPAALDLRWRQAPDMVPRDARITGDFCGVPRQALTPPGATVSARC